MTVYRQFLPFSKRRPMCCIPALDPRTPPARRRMSGPNRFDLRAESSGQEAHQPPAIAQHRWDAAAQRPNLQNGRWESANSGRERKKQTFYE